MQDTWAIAIIIAVVIMMVYWAFPEKFAGLKRDNFIAQYGVTRG